MPTLLHAVSDLWAQTGMGNAGTGQCGPGYKYKETVRKRADREALPGFDCPDCKGFYEAMASWGHLKVSQMPSCGHAPPGMPVA